MRPKVPYARTAMKMPAHALVMMRPMGNIPKWVPGKTNLAFAAAEAAAACAAAVVLPVVESWNSPLTKEASFDDSWVCRVEPFAMPPARVIFGVRSACWMVLFRC